MTYSDLRARVRDSIQEALEWDKPTNAESVEDAARTAAEQALDNALIYTATVIEIWRDIPQIDPEEIPDTHAGIIERMTLAIYETFFESDYFDARDDAIAKVVRDAASSTERNDALDAFVEGNTPHAVILATYFEALGG